MLLYNTRKRGITMNKWNPVITKEEVQRRYRIFMSRYGNKFSDELKKEMDIHFVRRVGKFDNPTVFYQLYDYFGIVPDDINMYIYHLNNIKEKFNINSDILEIAGGSYPSFARRVAREQMKIGVGTITVYDPKLVTNHSYKYNNLKLHPEVFTSSIDVSDYDLLVGIMPCKASDEMIEAIYKYKRDFYIAFCGCNSLNYNSFFTGMALPSYYNQIDELKCICEENNLGDLVIEYIPDKYNIEYPIVYNKRKI